MVESKDLEEYVPQQGFLSLLMTGDGKCIGSKYGIGFYGNWVWGLKDYIDMSFMNLFNANLLFEDFIEEGTKKPLPVFNMFEDATEEDLELIQSYKEMAASIEPAEAAKILACSPEEYTF